MTREEMIDILVDRDVESIRNDILNDDVSFLECILRGDMWTPWNQCSDSQLRAELKEMGIEESKTIEIGDLVVHKNVSPSLIEKLKESH
jgi:hypothetical protein